MRAPRPSGTPTLLQSLFLLFILGLTCFGVSSTGFAAEVAELRNGFTIPHRSHELRGNLIRLYIDETKKSFVDIPAEQIQRFSTQPDPEPATLKAEDTPASATEGKHGPPAAENPATIGVPAVGLLGSKSTEQIVREASESHGVDSDFIDSVIKQESAGNAHAVSKAGARGLMQLMPGTAAQLGVQDSFSPEQNVHGGARYLRELLERYRGDAVKALAAYNAGPGAVDRYHGVPPYRETRAYVARIVRDYNRKKQRQSKGNTATSAKTRQSLGAKNKVYQAKAAGVAGSSENFENY